MRKLDPKKHPKLIAFLEKTQKVLKTVAVICFSLVIVLCVFFYTKACADKNTAQLISASAEEASTVAESENIASTLYPSANLIPYPYQFKIVAGSLSNVTISDNRNGSFKLSGNADYDLFYLLQTVTLPAGTYYVSDSGSNHSLAKIYVSLPTANYFENSSFTIGRSTVVEIRLAIYANFSGTATFYPMVNVGEVAYPFIPNLDGVYENGYEVGETAGKESGYNEGLEQARYGFWAGATVNVRASLNYKDIFSWSGTPEYFSQGVNFNGIYEQFKDDADILRASLFVVTLNFSSPIQMADFAFKIYSPNSTYWRNAVYIHAYYGNGAYVSSDIRDVDDDLNFMEVQFFDSVVNSDYYKLEFGFSDFSALKGATFSTYVPYYEQGYDAGYKAGYNDNGAYDDGYKNGYDEGRSDGFQEGFNQTKSGGFGWLISSVQQFLSTNFFGDFGVGSLLYVALGLSLVTLFLKFFAGG